MSIEKEYQVLLKSGMFWEFFPELTGEWEADKEAFTNELKNRRGNQ